MTHVEEPPLGAHAGAGGVRFRVWSDKAREVSVVLYDRPSNPGREVALERGQQPHTFETWIPDLQPGALYDFKLDGRAAVDPYARSLPFGVRGPARVVGPMGQRKAAKRRIALDQGEVLYELHVGTFTPEGTFEAARQRLPHLLELGITTIELMPIASFPGARGWGYDGVGLFAPFAVYGSVQDACAFLEAAHALGMSVILDVVYNHLGPDGNTLPAFSDAYFDSQRNNPWGRAPALEKQAFRRLILENARYWLSEVGFDGLRLDATHELEPGGDPHILSELSRIARDCSPPAVLFAEDNRNDPHALLAHGIDAVWSDDFHHALHVLLTAEQEGYYRAFTGQLSDLAHIAERGQLFEGQLSATGEPRGKSAAGIPFERFVFALQNHDQIGNRAHGERLHQLAGFAAFRAASLLLLFLPATPLLFMGQEWAEDAPFLYFSDHEGELGARVSHGRRQEFHQFSAFHGDELGQIPDPQAESSFLRSKLDWSARAAPEHAQTLALYRRALELRRQDPVLRSARELRAGTSENMLWVIRRSPEGERLLLLNTGPATSLGEIAGRSAAEARLLLSSNDAAHSGGARFDITGQCASIFALAPASQSGST